MAGKPKADRETEIIKEALKRVNEALTHDEHNRRPAYNDLRMSVGEDHWLDGKTDFKKTRGDDGRPCLVFNRLPGFANQVIGDFIANTPSCKCHPEDDKATIELADLREGRIRNIEAESDAETAYIVGAKQISKGAFGAWRVITEYADENSFNQHIRIKPIHNQFAVIWDYLSQNEDKTDARWVAVLDKIHKDDYKKKYKGKSATSFEVRRGGMQWYLGEVYTICEYFRREDGETKTIYMLPIKDEDLPEEILIIWMGVKAQGFENGQIVEEIPEELKEVWQQLLKEDMVKQRRVQTSKIARYLLSGHEILEERQEWVSDTYWPIVPVSGPETNIDGKIYRTSIIRQAKDAQKAYNFGRNTAIEDFALVPKAPYLVTPEQIKGFEEMWQLAHKKTYPFLYYNKDPKAPMEGAPQRTQPTQASSAITESTMMAVDEMRATTNVFDPGMQQVSPDMSGVAVKARVSRAGIANYEFINNLAKARALTWRILLDILPKIEDTKREVKTRKQDGTVKMEKINWPNEEHRHDPSKPALLNDMSVGKYGVTVTVGPSYATQRIEAAENILKLMEVLPPQLGIVLAHFVVKNFDWHGAQEAAELIQTEMVKLGKGYLYPPEALQKIMQKISVVPPLPPPPLVMVKMQQEKFKMMKAQMEVVKKQIEMKQLNEGHIWDMMMKVEEAGRAVLEREQQRMMQPRSPAQEGTGTPQGPMEPPIPM